MDSQTLVAVNAIVFGLSGLSVLVNNLAKIKVKENLAWEKLTIDQKESLRYEYANKANFSDTESGWQNFLRSKGY